MKEHSKLRLQLLRNLYTADRDVANQACSYESHRARIPNRVDNTCTWFTKHPKFLEWHEKDQSSVLWVTAAAGCGKSVAASAVIETLETTLSRQRPSGTVCYFFFRDDNYFQGDALHALRALIHQLLIRRATLPNHLLQEWQHKGDGIFKEFDSLWELFLSTVAEEDGYTACVLDGVDECEGVSQKSLVSSVANFYHNLRQKSPKPSQSIHKIKLVLTTRPLNSVLGPLRKLADCHLKGEEESESLSWDIQRVIQHDLNHLVQQEVLSSRTSTRLRKALAENQGQTFLWLALIMEKIKTAANEGASENELLIILEDTSVYGLYAKFLDDAVAQSRTAQTTMNLLQIIISARRPLTLLEINHALSIQEEISSTQQLEEYLHNNIESYLRRLAGFLLTFRNGRAYFIHQTAKDFLMGDGHCQNNALEQSSSGWYRSIRLSAANEVLALRCIWYLWLDELNSEPTDGTEDYTTFNLDFVRSELIDQYPLLGYAATYWYHHVRESGMNNQHQCAKKAVSLCDTRGLRFWTWFVVKRPFWSSYMTEAITASDHLAIAHLSDQEVASKTLETSAMNLHPSKQLRPLHWAISERKIWVLMILMRLKKHIPLEPTEGQTLECIRDLILDASKTCIRSTKARRIYDILVFYGVSFDQFRLHWSRGRDLRRLHCCLAALQDFQHARTSDEGYSALTLAVIHSQIDNVRFFCEMEHRTTPEDWQALYNTGPPPPPSFID